MGKTATYLKRFWTDQSGGTLAPVILIVAIIGTAVAAGNILVEGAISQVHISR